MRPQDRQLPGSSADQELLELNINLWRQLTDEVFEKHFRRLYFGDEAISRHEAVARLIEQRTALSTSMPVSAQLSQTTGPEATGRDGEQAAITQTQVQTEALPAPASPAPHITILPAARFPWQSLLLSVAVHGVMLWTMLSVRLPQRKLMLINFETDTIAYYKVSQSLPDVRPRKHEQTSPTPRPKERAAKSDTTSDQEAQIRPDAKDTTETVVERQDLAQVPALPKLELPNIVMQTARIGRVREPLVLTPEVARYLALPIQQPQPLNHLLQSSLASSSRQPVVLRPQLAVLAEVTTNVAVPLDRLAAGSSLLDRKPAGLPYAAPPVEEPASGFELQQKDLPRDASQIIASRQPVAPRPQLAVLAEITSSVSVPLNQIPTRPSRLDQGAPALPYAAPPVEEPVASFQLQQLPAAKGPDLLVYSASPAIPGKEVAVPRVSTSGRLMTSPNTLPAGVSEIAQASIVVPSVSIRNRTVPNPPGTGSAVVQAPAPKLVEKEKRSASLLDFLPSRIPTTKPSLIGTKSGEPPASPLQEYEQQGGPVYTAAINAPNFTSKRGSWIIRFAELPAIQLEVQSTGERQDLSRLSAPSATVKVDPKYPPEVVREKVEGVVVLFAILRKDGSIDSGSVRVIRKLDPRLDTAARDALLGWKFKPSAKNGAAVDIQMEVSIPFYFRREAL